MKDQRSRPDVRDARRPVIQWRPLPSPDRPHPEAIGNSQNSVRHTHQRHPLPAPTRPVANTPGSLSARKQRVGVGPRQEARTTKRSGAQGPRGRTDVRRPAKTTPATPLQDRFKSAWKNSIAFRVVLAALVALVAFSLWPNSDEADIPAGLESNEVMAENSPVIAPAAAKEIVVPRIGLRAEFEDGSCRVKDNAINPATLDRACTYTSDDRPYSLPGTDASDIVVVAGHTGAGVHAVFDKLYDGRANRHTISVGDKMYLRTANSGDNWLVYSATDLHEPKKEGLAEDSAIWGDGPRPGRLLTISCIQPANPLASSARNAVIGWQFQGVSHSTKTSGSP
ncbi:hypothetical protein CAURIC_09820 [Corynebacterium auriscanis]|nr:hypothetical protein CAURIC_09820 [Corynebacterium auriscanis]